MLQTMGSALLELVVETPSARTLAHAVTEAVRTGRLSSGERLPPIRMVARHFQVSPTTVSAAWSLLARAGTITTDGRRGTTIAAGNPGPARYRRALDRDSPLTLNLSTGLPDPALLPDLRPALARLDPTFSVGSYLGEPILPELEQKLREEWPYAVERITVVDGAMDAMDLISRIAAREQGHVVVEDPCFPPVLDLLEARRVSVTGVPVDAEGMTPEALRRALTPFTAAVYLQPRGQNPTGVSMSPARASALAGILRRSRALLVEDDSTAAVSAGPAVSIGQWLPQQVVHIRSFSKSHGPELRLAAMSGPAELIARLVSLRQLGQGWSSRILQRLLLDLLSDADSRTAVEVARDRYRARRVAMVGYLATAGIDVLGGDGFNLWLPVADETAAVLSAAGQGLGVAPGSPFTVRPGSPHIRVTTSCVAERDVPLVGRILVAAARSAPRIRA